MENHLCLGCVASDTGGALRWSLLLLFQTSMGPGPSEFCQLNQFVFSIFACCTIKKQSFCGNRKGKKMSGEEELHAVQELWWVQAEHKFRVCCYQETQQNLFQCYG